MSLDVYLTTDTPIRRESTGIFVRENGQITEVSRDEWDERNPGHEPTVADQILISHEVYSANITHNLNTMADAAGIYQHLWRPEEIGVTKAKDLIEPLRAGLERLRLDPAGFSQYNSPNGWGLYEHFVPFVANYLAARQEHPEATVHVSR